MVGGNIRYSRKRGRMRTHVEGHGEQFRSLSPPIPPRNSSSLTSLGREACPPSTPLQPLPPHNPRPNPSSLASLTQEACPPSTPPATIPYTPPKKPFIACLALKRQETHTPGIPLVLYPLVLHCQSQNYPFQGFLGPVRASVSQRWLQMALNHLFGPPSGLGTTLEKSFFTTLGSTGDPCNPLVQEQF